MTADPKRPWWRLEPTGTNALALSLVTTILFMLVVWLIPHPPPYVSISLETELVRYRVVRTSMAAIALQRATLLGSHCENDDIRPGMLAGLLTPADNAIVQYRWSPEGVAIEIGGVGGTVATLTFHDESICDLVSGQVVVTIPLLADQGAHARPLPIAGPAEAGSELSVATAPGPETRLPRSMIRSGEIQVFGRSSLYLGGSELYPVAEATYPVPAGSRLASGTDFRSLDATISGASWYGGAWPGQDGLLVSATTDTNSLLLYRPGLDDQTETFSFGLLTRVFNDPGLGLLTLGLASFFVLAGAITGWMSFWRRT